MRDRLLHDVRGASRDAVSHHGAGCRGHRAAGRPVRRRPDRRGVYSWPGAATHSYPGPAVADARAGGCGVDRGVPPVALTDTGPLRTAGEHRIRLTESEALANVRTVLELGAGGELRSSDKTSRPSAATMRTLDEHLAGGDFYADDPIASFAWPLLVQAGGLAAIEAGRLRLTAKGRTAARSPMPEVIRALWRRWLSHGVIDEFSRIEQIKGQRAANVLTAVKPRRQVVADTLTELPVGEWVGVDALFTSMRRDRRSPTIARNDRALWKLYLVDPQYGSLGYDGYHHWEILEGRYTLAVLFE